MPTWNIHQILMHLKTVLVLLCAFFFFFSPTEEASFRSRHARSGLSVCSLCGFTDQSSTSNLALMQRKKKKRKWYLLNVCGFLCNGKNKPLLTFSHFLSVTAILHTLIVILVLSQLKERHKCETQGRNAAETKRALLTKLDFKKKKKKGH